MTALNLITTIGLSVLTITQVASAQTLTCIDTNPLGRWVARTLTLRIPNKPPIPVSGELESWNPQAGKLTLMVEGQYHPVVIAAPLTVDLSFEGPSPVAQSAPPIVNKKVSFGPKSVTSSQINIQDGVIQILEPGSTTNANCGISTSDEMALSGTIDFTKDIIRISGTFTKYSEPPVQLGPEDVVRQKGG
jgi:hypothetical protein